MLETLDNLILSVFLFIFYLCVFSFMFYGGTTQFDRTENDHNNKLEINNHNNTIGYKEIFSSDFDPVDEDTLEVISKFTLTSEESDSLAESLWFESNDNSSAIQELEIVDNTLELKEVSNQEQQNISTDSSDEKEIADNTLQLTETFNQQENNSITDDISEVEAVQEVTTENIDFSKLKQKHIRALCSPLGLKAKNGKKWLPTKTIRSMIKEKAEQTPQVFIAAVHEKYPELALIA